MTARSGTSPLREIFLTKRQHWQKSRDSWREGTKNDHVTSQGRRMVALRRRDDHAAPPSDTPPQHPPQELLVLGAIPPTGRIPDPADFTDSTNSPVFTTDFTDFAHSRSAYARSAAGVRKTRPHLREAVAHTPLGT